MYSLKFTLLKFIVHLVQSGIHTSTSMLLQMASEEWKIYLHYADENQDQVVLEGSLEEKDISYYQLVHSIEQVGFSPAFDYLYYRKKYPRGRGYLVHIDNDTHVRKMISEHNNEKKVHLYVFKEKANIDVAPSDSQREDDGPVASLEEDAVFDEGTLKTRMRTSQSNCNFKLNNYFLLCRILRFTCAVHIL